VARPVALHGLYVAGRYFFVFLGFIEGPGYSWLIEEVKKKR